MLGMKHHNKCKPGSPASILMKGHTKHRDMGGTISTGGNDMGTNTGSSIARAPGADSSFKKGGSPKRRAMGGNVMDTMHGTDAPTHNKDILGTFHGQSSTGTMMRAAGGAGKTRKRYPNT